MVYTAEPPTVVILSTGIRICDIDNMAHSLGHSTPPGQGKKTV